MRRYSFAEACALLAVSEKALRRWFKDLNIQPLIEPGDRRRHLYTQAQVERVASIYGITLGQRPVTLRDVLARVEALERRMEQLEQQGQAHKQWHLRNAHDLPQPHPGE